MIAVVVEMVPAPSQPVVDTSLECTGGQAVPPPGSQGLMAVMDQHPAV